MTIKTIAGTPIYYWRRRKQRLLAAAADPGELLWSATFDQPNLVPGEGDYPGLAEWDTNAVIVSTCNQDSNDVGASFARPASGVVKAGSNGGYAMYMGITPTTTAQAACRTFRNTESSANVPLYYFFTYGILNAEVDINGFMAIFGFKSRIEAGTNKVSWNLGLVNTTGTNMALRLAFNTDMDSGPFEGTPGGVPYFFEQYGTPVEFPANEFVPIQVYLKPSQNFDGAVRVWQGGQELIWDIGGNPYGLVHSCRTNQAGGVTTTEFMLYGQNLNDGNTTIEVLIDRAAIATGPIMGTALEPQRDTSYCYVSKDTYVIKANPNTASGTSTVIRVHNWTGAQGKNGLIQFDVAHFAGQTVVSAVAHFRNAVTATSNRTVNLHEIKAANANWEEDATANFANGSDDPWAGDANGKGCSVSGTDYEAAVGGTFTYLANSPLDTDLVMTLDTAMVQRWIDGDNNGALLAGVSTNDFDLRSSNYDVDPSKRPYIVVTVA